MKVTVEIKSCNECPHYEDGRGWGDSWCHNARRELINTYIPDWCPLKRKENK